MPKQVKPDSPTNPLDFKLPNGKRLGDATKEEIAAAAEWFREAAAAEARTPRGGAR
jgi:hypothetical protein